MTERNAEGLRGPRCVIKKGDAAFPSLLERVVLGVFGLHKLKDSENRR